MRSEAATATGMAIRKPGVAGWMSMTPPGPPDDAHQIEDTSMPVTIAGTRAPPVEPAPVQRQDRHGAKGGAHAAPRIGNQMQHRVLRQQGERRRHDADHHQQPATDPHARMRRLGIGDSPEHWHVSSRDRGRQQQLRIRSTHDRGNQRGHEQARDDGMEEYFRNHEVYPLRVRYRLKQVHLRKRGESHYTQHHRRQVHQRDPYCADAPPCRYLRLAFYRHESLHYSLRTKESQSPSQG